MKDICNQIIFISFLFYVLYQVKKCLAETNKYGSWPETDPGVTVDLGCKKQEEKGTSVKCIYSLAEFVSLYVSNNL
jgi:hypothetical protein